MKPARLAALLALILPASASAAPTLQPLKACYVAVGVDETTGNTISETVEVAGAGFSPNGAVDLLVDGNTAGRAVADGAGAIAGSVQAPLQERGEREFTLTANDSALGAVSVSSLVTALTVTVKPVKARPTQKVTITGRGFTAAAPAYAHYVRAGRDRKSIRLAQPTGSCGTFSVHRRQFPIRRPATGLWILRVDQEPRYKVTPATAFVDLEIFVKRVLRFKH
jgi:hypothetical protein